MIGASRLFSWSGLAGDETPDSYRTLGLVSVLASTRGEKSYEKYAWIPLFIVGVIMLLVGFSDLVGASAVVQAAEDATRIRTLSLRLY